MAQKRPLASRPVLQKGISSALNLHFMVFAKLSNKAKLNGIFCQQTKSCRWKIYLAPSKGKRATNSYDLLFSAIRPIFTFWKKFVVWKLKSLRKLKTSALLNFYFETFSHVKVSLSKIKVVNGLGDTYKIGILPTPQDCIMSWFSSHKFNGYTVEESLLTIQRVAL